METEQPQVLYNDMLNWLIRFDTLVRTSKGTEADFAAMIEHEYLAKKLIDRATGKEANNG